MALKDSQPEPSMEEILASIRRIISEEDGAPAASAGPVLDLTQPASQDQTDDLLVFEAEEIEPEAEPAPEPPARAPAPPLALHEPAPADLIVSQPAAAATAGTLARLAGTLRIAEREGQTLEGVVRELLKPMLKEWLDLHLPGIVEARVEAELERIARMAR